MKKFVIELDENKYKKMKQYIEQSGCSDYYDNAIAKAIPLEEELEKIKADIDEIVEREMEESQFWSLGLRYSKKIIDNHISKLKGESK